VNCSGNDASILLLTTYVVSKNPKGVKIHTKIHAATIVNFTMHWLDDSGYKCAGGLCVCICIHKFCVVMHSCIESNFTLVSHMMWVYVCGFVDMVPTVFATCDLRLLSVYFLENILYLMQITSMTGINTVIFQLSSVVS